MEIHNEIHAVSMSAQTAFILQPMEPELISTFKSYYLGTILDKAIPIIGVGSCEDLSKVNQEPSGKDALFQMSLRTHGRSKY